MVLRLGSKSTAKEDEEEEYEVDVVPDRLQSSRNSRLALFGSELRLDRFRPRRRRPRRPAVDGEDGFFHDLIILPDNKYAFTARSFPPRR
jgi:hyperpolarization activated cyclic nucleotide-gated potassium channel 4